MPMHFVESVIITILHSSHTFKIATHGSLIVFIKWMGSGEWVRSFFGMIFIYRCVMYILNLDDVSCMSFIMTVLIVSTVY